MSHNEYLTRGGIELLKGRCPIRRHPCPVHRDGQDGNYRSALRWDRVIAVPRNAPATGTIAENVPVLREASLPMHLDERSQVYSKFDVAKSAGQGIFQAPPMHVRNRTGARLTCND